LIWFVHFALTHDASSKPDCLFMQHVLRQEQANIIRCWSLILYAYYAIVSLECVCVVWMLLMIMIPNPNPNPDPVGARRMYMALVVLETQRSSVCSPVSRNTKPLQSFTCRPIRHCPEVVVFIYDMLAVREFRSNQRVLSPHWRPWQRDHVTCASWRLWLSRAEPIRPCRNN
jgi:hypothetical protein